MQNPFMKPMRLLWWGALALILAVVLTACGIQPSHPPAEGESSTQSFSTGVFLPDEESGSTEDTDPAEDATVSEGETSGESASPALPEDSVPPDSITAPGDSSMEDNSTPVSDGTGSDTETSVGTDSITEDAPDTPSDTTSTPADSQPADSEAVTECAHVPSVIPAVSPTCLLAGKTEGSTCTLCGDILTAQQEVPPTGHDYQPNRSYQCAACGMQAECPTPVLSMKGDVQITWGENLSLSWQYAEPPLFPVLCMVTATREDGSPVELWDGWRAETAYSRCCRQDGESLTLRVYACYEVDGKPVPDTQSMSAVLTVTVSTREALESPGYVTGNQVTTVPQRDVSVAWGSVSETGSRVVYDVLLVTPDGKTQAIQTAATETMCTVPADALTVEGAYTLQIIARDQNEVYRDSPAANISILVTPPLSVSEQDFSNPARYASDYFYEYMGTLENGKRLQSFYRLLDTSMSEFHHSAKTAQTVQVTGGTTYHYAVKLNFSTMGLTLEEAISVRALYLYDHPLYYWISNIYVYSNTTLYMCVEEDYATGAARAAGNELVYSGVSSMAEGILGDESSYRIALAYYERLLARADYAYEDDGTTPQDDHWAHSIMGVFDPAHNEVVCEGFAKAYGLLLNYHGVENIPVIGESRGVGHMWNLLRLDDGAWYWCDITWDDKTRSPLGTDYKYFCVTDTQDVLYYYIRDGIESGGRYTFTDSATFMDDHAVRWDMGITLDMSDVLPERAATPFDSVGLEMRETFVVDGMTYAKTGYGKVQLVDVGNRRNVTVPESVTHNGITYTVTSIGLINSEGVYMTGRLLPMFASTVYVPKTVTYVWEDALYAFMVTVTVDPENPNYTTQNGVLTQKK